MGLSVKFHNSLRASAMNPCVLPSVLLACSGLLVACGGSAPSAQTPASCLTPLKYISVQNSSGRQIAPVAVSDDWNFDPKICDLQKLSAATLKLCLDHPNLADLQGSLQLAGQNVRLLTIGDGEVVGDSCLASTTTSTSLRAYELDLDNVPAAHDIAGPWRVTIEDRQPGDSPGYFVAWQLELRGLR